MKLGKIGVLIACAAVAFAGVTGCSTAPKSEGDKAALTQDVNTALSKARASDPSLDGFLKKAHGYAVFPSVGKGAVGVGGAYGRGEVFENGRMIGYCDLSQGTIGLQLGGQAYSEIIAFETKESLDKFKKSEFAFSAQATAVALKSGAGATAKYTNGVAVFTMSQQGLMLEASIGGQSFTFQPL